MLRVLRPLVAACLGLALIAPAHAEKRPRMKKPRHGRQIAVGPVSVPRGYEITDCSYMKFPGKKDMNINKVQIRVGGGSHHVHLYRALDPALNLPDGHETCNMSLDFDVWQLVFASQSVRYLWKLPPGVAFHFRAGEQLTAQTHFVDVGLLDTAGDGYATFNLHAIPDEKVKYYAGSFFGQDRDVKVPAHTTSTATTNCVFDRPIKLLQMTGHYHFRGKKFVATSWDSTPGYNPTVLYHHEGYEDPTVRTWGDTKRDPAPEVKGISWTCEYQNDTDKDFTFGPFTEDNEHCNLFFFYYPTVGKRENMTCVQKNGVATTTVHNN
jgi:hypothetical protein